MALPVSQWPGWTLAVDPPPPLATVQIHSPGTLQLAHHDPSREPPWQPHAWPLRDGDPVYQWRPWPAEATCP